MLVKIVDVSVIAGEARRGQVAEALAWAQEHQDMLMRTWLELNQRE